VAPPVFKTGLAANIVAGGFDSLPPPPPLPSGRVVKRELPGEQLRPAENFLPPVISDRGAFSFGLSASIRSTAL
jgi:hypothetical protein